MSPTSVVCFVYNYKDSEHDKNKMSLSSQQTALTILKQIN